jgi:hypothetical protein
MFVVMSGEKERERERERRERLLLYNKQRKSLDAGIVMKFKQS